jgi:phosphoribosyl 1,2-cyclic phosphate phosphodiesterase
MLSSTPIPMPIMFTASTICAGLRCRNASAFRSTPIPRRWHVFARASVIAWKRRPGSEYPPITEPRLINSLDDPILIDGAGGTIAIQPLDQVHGSIRSLGYRIGDLAYCCDVSDFPRATIERLQGLDTLIIDSLQYKPHPSHLSVDQALWWIEKLDPKRAYLTHMHVPLDYETVANETPERVEPCYDGLTFEIEVNA